MEVSPFAKKLWDFSTTLRFARNDGIDHFVIPTGAQRNGGIA
jgi:hypothetical protein